MLLNVQELCVSYLTKKTELKAVDHVSFGIERGDTLGIIGESGSGKSTIVMAMLRQLDPRFSKITGRVEFDGQELLTLPDAEFKKLLWKRIAIVFQKSMNSLSPVHRLGSQFEDIYRVHEPHATKAQIHDRAVELFKLVNLPERVYRLYPHDLSVVASACRKTLVLYSGQVMEFGTVEQVIKQHLHPYTEGLIRSFPSLYGEKQALRGIPGSLPDLTDPPAGCVFAPRCPYATERCRQERPQVREYEPGHFAACHRCQEREAE